MSVGATAEAVRRGAGLFRLEDRGLIEVTGADRLRWLDGMLTNDVAAASAPGAGCRALLLTRQGRVVADLHLLSFPERLWLETARGAVAPALAALEKLVIADDVELADASERVARLALEGPSAPAILAAAAEGGLRPEALPADHFAEARIAGVPVQAAAFGFSGEPAFQLFAAPDSAAAVAEALRAAGADRGLVEGGPPLLELLRIEAGTPRFGAELDESVLPDEARLGDAVSTTKGCFIGQEVVARLRSRERLQHLLVGLRFADPEPPAPGAEIHAAERRVGEVTSAVRSPLHGAIALGYVRCEHAEPGTRLAVGGGDAEVAELPFTAAASSSGP